MTNNRLFLAEVIAVQGLKGVVKLRSFTSDPLDLAEYPLEDEAGKAVEFDIVGEQPKAVLLAKIAGVADRTAAEAWIGRKLYTAARHLPALAEDEFYAADLAGLQVRDAAGKAVGRVHAVHDFGAGDILELSLDGVPKTELLAFTKANFPDIHLAEGWIRFIPPDELVAAEPAS